VNDPSTGKTVAALTFFKQHLNDSMHRAGAWWSHTLPQLPPLDTPNNVALAYAIAFVFSVFLVLLAMYACRIFLKV
jgi:hypothetical protein